MTDDTSIQKTNEPEHGGEDRTGNVPEGHATPLRGFSNDIGFSETKSVDAEPDDFLEEETIGDLEEQGKLETGHDNVAAEQVGYEFSEEQETTEPQNVFAEEQIVSGTKERIEPISAAPEPMVETSESKESGVQESTSEAGLVTPSQVEEPSSQVDYSRTFRSLTEGEVVDGVVVHIDKEGVLVDVGTKSEGIIRPNELSSTPIQSAEEVVSVGDRIDVYVMQSENADGNPVLSKKRADFEVAWDRVQEAFEQGKILTAMVTDRVKGGLKVDLGIQGFVPGSHVGGGHGRNLERYVGQSLPFKVIEVDRERRKVVLSHRLAVEEERSRVREATIASLKEGQVRQGIVRRITDYGAFVDLGGIDGLLHVSEMSWTRIGHPSEVVRVSEKINVMVLKVDLEAGRISLGLRQILPDPWSDIGSKYAIGEIVKGTISRLVPFGAFVQLEEGIEGIIPNAELSHKRVRKPEEVVSVGDTIEARILEIRPEERRMTLSIRQLQEERDKLEYEGYRSSRADGSMTLGDLVGEKLGQLISRRRHRSSSRKSREAKEPEYDEDFPEEIDEEEIQSSEEGLVGEEAPEPIVELDEHKADQITAVDKVVDIVEGEAPTGIEQGDSDREEPTELVATEASTDEAQYTIAGGMSQLEDTELNGERAGLSSVEEQIEPVAAETPIGDSADGKNQQAEDLGNTENERTES